MRITTSHKEPSAYSLGAVLIYIHNTFNSSVDGEQVNFEERNIVRVEG
jgi:hypothetical protein